MLPPAGITNISHTVYVQLIILVIRVVAVIAALRVDRSSVESQAWIKASAKSHSHHLTLIMQTERGWN